jgi:hypothetical protein
VKTTRHPFDSTTVPSLPDYGDMMQPDVLPGFIVNVSQPMARITVTYATAQTGADVIDSFRSSKFVEFHPDYVQSVTVREVRTTRIVRRRMASPLSPSDFETAR